MNHASKNSLASGSKHQVAGTAYVGANPEYTNMAIAVGMPHFVKTKKGIPFVRADKQ